MHNPFMNFYVHLFQYIPSSLSLSGLVSDVAPSTNVPAPPLPGSDHADAERRVRCVCACVFVCLCNVCVTCVYCYMCHMCLSCYVCHMCACVRHVCVCVYAERRDGELLYFACVSCVCAVCVLLRVCRPVSALSLVSSALS